MTSSSVTNVVLTWSAASVEFFSAGAGRWPMWGPSRRARRTPPRTHQPRSKALNVRVHTGLQTILNLNESTNMFKKTAHNQIHNFVLGHAPNCLAEDFNFDWTLIARGINQLAEPA